MAFRNRPRPESSRSPREAALALIARRPYSVGEMRRSLEATFSGSGDLEAVVSALRAAGYLDDAKVSRQIASSLARHRAYGRARIRQELKRRLFDFRVIEPALDAAFQESNERDLLEKALNRKLRSLRPPIEPRKMRSLVASLVRRGFRMGDILSAVRARPELKHGSESIDMEDEQQEITND